MSPFSHDVRTIGNMLRQSQNSPKYSQTYSPTRIHDDIILHYPGKKNNGIDYLLRLNEKIVYHSHIANVLYTYGQQGYTNGLVDFLVNLYENGLVANHENNLPENITILDENLTFEEFKHLVYFTILQEDINYPRPRFYGIAMPLIRFLEAIIASEQPELIDLPTVIQRINNHGGPPPRPFAHANLHNIFVEALEHLENR